MQNLKELINIAKAAGLHLKQDLKLDESGADFLVMHAKDIQDNAWIVRFPRRPDVMPRASIERNVLDFVRPRLSVSVPSWRISSPDVIAYPRLEGEPAAIVDMEIGDYRWQFDPVNPPATFLDSLAKSLADLHRIDQEGAGMLEIRRMTVPEIREAHQRRMTKARQHLEIPDAVWRRWQNWLEDETCWPTRTAFVHGDVHPPHLLIDSSHSVVGLLDWTEAHIGDPATDFAILYATLGRERIDTILARYSNYGGYTWTRMLDHIAETWAAYPTTLIEFAELSGEDGPVQLAHALISAQLEERSGIHGTE